MTERAAYPSDLSDARWTLIAPRLTAWREARTDAGVGRRTAGINLLEQAKAAQPWSTWVDAGFKTTVIEHGATLGIDVEVVTRDPQVKGFSVIKRRWVVERTLGWLMLHRRLARDYETPPDTSAAMIHIEMITT